MYFPYLRGKQFELIALRDLASAGRLYPDKVSPIIEPVRIGLKSIRTAVRALHPLGIQVQLIINPKVGELTGKTDDIIAFIKEQRESSVNNIIPTFIIQSDEEVGQLKELTASYNYDFTGYAVILMSSVRDTEGLAQYIDNTECKSVTIHMNHVFALRRKFKTKAILGDYFRKQKVSADYAENIDEVFSSDCFFYKTEGFNAFSDFQGIGSDWIEGGMLPKAVVIHLTYKDPQQDEIRIHHFVSTAMDNSLDVAGKFYQANTKLIEFADQHRLASEALNKFRELHLRQGYPGLGTIKKLSIMHHIELMQSLI